MKGTEMKVIEFMQTVAEVHGEDEVILNAALKWYFKVDLSGDCWTWSAGTNKGGYGVFSTGTRSVGESLAHRVGYRLLGKQIPEGLTLDHLCSEPSCVNPDHLEPTPMGTNLRRARKRRREESTHCVNGHPWDENEISNPNKDGHATRRCAACHREREHARYHATKE